MSFDLFPEVVERALRVAAYAHREQTRKGCDIPYLTHPAGVALILANAGYTEPELLAAALLHDVVEDTNYSLDQCRIDFPAGVCALVEALTERKYDEHGKKLPWKIRKSEHLARLQGASADVKALALADKLHNLTTIVFDLSGNAEIWSRFNASPAEILWYYRSMCELIGEAEDFRLKRLESACRKQIFLLEQQCAART